MDFAALSRAQLQRMAKEAGIKANQKTADIVAALQAVAACDVVDLGGGGRSSDGGGRSSDGDRSDDDDLRPLAQRIANKMKPAVAAAAGGSAAAPAKQTAAQVDLERKRAMVRARRQQVEAAREAKALALARRAAGGGVGAKTKRAPPKVLKRKADGGPFPHSFALRQVAAGGAKAIADDATLVEGGSMTCATAPPAKGTWLAEYPSERRGQTLARFVAQSPAINLRAQPRRKIVLVPLDGGEQPPYRKYVRNRSVFGAKSRAMLAEYLRIFLQFAEEDVVVAPSMTMAELAVAASSSGRSRNKIDTRTDTNSDGETYLQFDLDGMLNSLTALQQDRFPDAYTVVGFTPSLLYNKRTPAIKYYGGLARKSSAVFSFFTVPCDAPSLKFGTLSILAHEVLHTLGVSHCAYYDSCFMRGSASHEEGLEIPLICCPVELAKLKAVAPGLDGMARYRQLRAFYAKHKMPRVQRLMDARIADVEAELARQNNQISDEPAESEAETELASGASPRPFGGGAEKTMH